MAEALLRDLMDVRGIDARTASAGLVFDGRPAEVGAVKAMARRGLDIEEHRSRVITPSLAADATLLLTMERDQVRRICEIAPDVFPRSFTLPEFVRSAAATGARSPDQGLDDWIARIGAPRRMESYLSAGHGDDIADPMGRSRRVFRACADLIDAHVQAFVDLAWPGPPPTGDHAVAKPTSTGSP